MARPRSAETLERLVEAARSVFAESGWRGARVAEVAARAGVAHGTVYGYAAGKEALLDLVLRGRPLPTLPELPWPAPPHGRLLRAAERRCEAIHALPELDLSLEGSDVVDASGELFAILSAHHGRVRTSRHELAALERTARDWPPLASVLARHRRDLANRMARYLRRRGHLGWIAPLPDAGVAARAALDSVARCARREQHDPDPAFVAETVARDTVVGILVRGLLAPAAEEPPRSARQIH